MNHVLSLESLFNQFVIAHFYETGVKPNSLELSPGLYRRLMEIRSSERPLQDTMTGCPAMEEVSTVIGNLKVVIDECLGEFEFVCA